MKLIPMITRPPTVKKKVICTSLLVAGAALLLSAPTPSGYLAELLAFHLAMTVVVIVAIWML
jgi:hypothetical protein